MPTIHTLDQEDFLEQRDVPLGRGGRKADLRRDPFDVQRLRHRSGEQPQQPPKLAPPFDLGQLGHISVDEVVDVGVEELRAPAGRTPQSFGEATSQSTLDVSISQFVTKRTSAGQRGCPFVVEDPIDKPFITTVDLALRERPQLDGLHPPHERIGQLAQTQQPRRTCQQELSWPRICVDRSFDRQHKLWHPLHLVDGQQTVVAYKPSRVAQSRLSFRRDVKTPLDRVRIRPEQCLHERALAYLPGAVDRDHPRVRKGLVRHLLGSSRNVRKGRHATIPPHHAQFVGEWTQS